MNEMIPNSFPQEINLQQSKTCNDDAQSYAAGTTEKPSVAIVILNWNGKKFLEQFLPSVIASVYQNKRVIVADNASTDDSVAYLETNYPQIQILRNATNEGFAKGYNTALKQIQSDYYVLLNSDVEVTPDWINPIINLMEANKNIAACQPKILSYENKNMFEYAGASGGWIDYLGYPFSRGRVFNDCEEDKGQYENAEPCFWASGAALFVNAKVYHHLGGLDEYFFAHQEEIDFCWRAQLAGYKIYVQPASVVYHVGGGSLAKGSSKKTYLNFRNNLIMLFKNLPFKQAIWKIPARLTLDGISAWRGFLSGDFGYFKAIIKAHLHFVKWVFGVPKNKKIEKNSNIKLKGWVNTSIVWAYFIKKQKTFAEIVK